MGTQLAVETGAVAVAMPAPDQWAVSPPFWLLLGLAACCVLWGRRIARILR